MIGKDIFKSFYQLHDVDRDGTKGMGIDIQRTIAALLVIKACPFLWFMAMLIRDEAQGFRIQCDMIVYGIIILELKLIVKPERTLSFHDIP